jgi:zinc D-Ala-D-Ala carboxypeptidase
MTTTFYDNWRDVPEGAWRWKNFSPAAIAAAEWGKLLSTGCRRSVTTSSDN